MTLPRRVPSWRLLLACFAVIALLFAATKIVSWVRGRQLHAAIQKTMREALTSAELVARMGRDLDGERQLLDNHILESNRAGMERDEERLTALEHDLTAAASAYDALADEPEEARVSGTLDAELVETQHAVAEVLALSRDNRDVDARRQLALADRHFARIGADIAELVTLNRVAVTRSLAGLDRAEDGLNLLLGGLALAGIALTAVVGGVAIGLVHRRERQLVRYSSRLEEQNQELDAFAGRVAHDLRRPLTAMRLAAWRLVNSPDSQSASGAIDRSVARMDTLIRDLLALSHVESQAREGFCDPAAVAAAVRDEVTPRLDAAAATIEIEVEPGRVGCGEGLLTTALANLVDNALKYRRPDAPPHIAVSGRAASGRYELRVSDNGIGMSADECHRAFAPFWRALRDPSRSGTGLGLSIVKRIAEANGGEVAVESALGHGSTFILRLRTV